MRVFLLVLLGLLAISSSGRGEAQVEKSLEEQNELINLEGLSVKNLITEEESPRDKREAKKDKDKKKNNAKKANRKRKGKNSITKNKKKRKDARNAKGKNSGKNGKSKKKGGKPRKAKGIKSGKNAKNKKNRRKAKNAKNKKNGESRKNNKKIKNKNKGSNERKNKKTKTGKKIKTQGRRKKTRKTNKKDGKSTKRNGNKKNRMKIKTLRRRRKQKTQKGKKSRSKGRQSTDTTSTASCPSTQGSDTCLQNAVDALNFEKNQIQNFYKQNARIKNHNKTQANKQGKKGEFMEAAKYMLQAIGGNISKPTCGESGTKNKARSANSAVENYNILINCSSTIKEACTMPAKTYNATVKELFDNCSFVFNKSKTAADDCRTNKAYTSNGTAACACWVKAAKGIEEAKKNNCKATDTSKQVKAAKNKCA